MDSLWYTYKTTRQIIDTIPHLSDFSNYQFISLIFILVITLLLIYYLLPILNLSLQYLKEDKVRINKRKFLEKISMQKKLEDEIMKEIEMES